MRIFRFKLLRLALSIISEVPARAFGDMQPSAHQAHEESQPQHSHLRGKPSLTKSSVSDPDPHGFGSLGSGFVLRIGIRIQEQGNLPKLTNKPDPAFRNGFVPTSVVTCTYVFQHITYIFMSSPTFCDGKV
jgi:hypothetical protein